MSDLIDVSPPGQLSNDTLAAARAFFYNAGTTTLRTVYADEAETVAHPSPLVADADGLFPQVFVSGGAVKVVMQDSTGATLYTLDPAVKVAATGQGASSISFTPSIDNPATDVQTAIENAQASAATGFAAFGLGVTGSVALLAALDATNIASGLYRFDATTTGTYPTGVAAADTGAIVLMRETAGSAWMRLYHDTTDRTFERRMNSSTWGAWRETISSDIGATQGDILFRSATNWTRLPAGTSGQVLRTNGAGANPSWAAAPGIVAWVNFNGVPATGTYSRTGTLVTVTMTGHGMATGMRANLDFTSGTATDGTYTVTVVDANTFTVVDAASGTTSGNVTRNLFIRASLNVASVTDGGTGTYTINFASALSDANYVVSGFCNFTGGGAPAGILTAGSTFNPTTTALPILTGDSAAGSLLDSAHIHVTVVR